MPQSKKYLGSKITLQSISDEAFQDYPPPSSIDKRFVHPNYFVKYKPQRRSLNMSWKVSTYYIIISYMLVFINDKSPHCKGSDLQLPQTQSQLALELLLVNNQSCNTFYCRWKCSYFSKAPSKLVPSVSKEHQK